MYPTGSSSTLTQTDFTGELEEHIAATGGDNTFASTSADVTVSSLTTITSHRVSEEQRGQAVNLRNSDLELTTFKDSLSLQSANTQISRRRPRNAEQIERTNSLAVVTHRGIGRYFTCVHLVISNSGCRLTLYIYIYFPDSINERAGEGQLESKRVARRLVLQFV